MSYDKADWHSGGSFPADLPPEAASTHIGMFFAWMALHGLAGELHTEEDPDELQALLDRKISPGAYVRRVMDDKLWDVDFNDRGNAFAKAYYGEKGYYDDLISVTRNLPSEYHLPDTWESYEAIAPLIGVRFEKWQGAS